MFSNIVLIYCNINRPEHETSYYFNLMFRYIVTHCYCGLSRCVGDRLWNLKLLKNQFNVHLTFTINYKCDNRKNVEKKKNDTQIM